jgi:UDP-N-acetylglucosamine transferase subunit ALG13
MDEIAATVSESVVMQVGTSKLKSSNPESRPFYTDHEYDSLFEEARVVVSHAGIGTLLRASETNKPFVCVPRLKRYGEHWDDHQLEVCEELGRRGSIRYFSDVARLNADTLSSPPFPRFRMARSTLADRILSVLAGEE